MAIPTKQTRSNGGRGGGGGDSNNNFDVHAAAAPIRYLSLDDVYSATSPTCVTTSSGSSSTLMSKKIKARKLPTPNNTAAAGLNHLSVENPNLDRSGIRKPKPNDVVVECNAVIKRRRSEIEIENENENENENGNASEGGGSIRFVYTRRKKRAKCDVDKTSFFDTLRVRVELGLNCPVKEETREVESERGDKVEALLKKKKEEEEKKRKSGNGELLKLGVGDFGGLLSSGDGPRLRENRNRNVSGGGVGCGSAKRKKCGSGGNSVAVQNVDKSLQVKKRWVRFGFEFF